jgi:aminoglycoside phosphotransferase (APT) family kinase protein
MAEPLPSPERFQSWLNALPGFQESTVEQLEPLDGGASNITCRVRLQRAPLRDVVLRVQRERGIFEPYDVVREGRVLSCLHGSAVPVPELLGSEASPAPLGAPFIVMEWVNAPHMGVAGPEASYPAFTAAVAATHALDWRALGLDFLGVPATAGAGLAGELDAIAARQERFAAGDTLLTAAQAALRRSIPDDGKLALCQGDINVFNFLFRAQQVVAVVDWEQARISDPRSDIGQLLALGHLKGMPFGPADEAAFVMLYETISGRDLPGMAWFRARWLWELGVIYHGWKAFNASDPWYTWTNVATLLTQALAEV